MKEMLITVGKDKYILSHKGIIKRIIANMQRIESEKDERFNTLQEYMDEVLTLEFGEEYLKARKSVFAL